IFRRRLKDCRLTNIERELFSFERSDDIPGYLVPSVYFEWLSSDSLELLPDVLEHNRLDILSLFYLVDHIASIHRSRGEVLDEVDDLHSLSRVYSRRRDQATVQSIIDRMEGSGDSELADDIILFNALNFKRANALDRAVPLWHRLSQIDSREGFWANLELAKYYEHREHDPARAYLFASRARDICPYGETRQQQLVLRLERLLAKLRPEK
ncbi:MAG TPA: ribonuclease H-like domain-containing protein, partial [candidate division Zixibacteria bacterium]|nr:ribonuclease H-like domain-containing protein [candidate division Zixibacteria bacterium]